jgi:hypothetical protein
MGQHDIVEAAGVGLPIYFYLFLKKTLWMLKKELLAGSQGALFKSD